MDNHAEEFERHRAGLFAIAYRMTGVAADAEDLVQECFLRWNGASREEIESPRAFLITVITRLAINHLESARVKREQYVGPWLPEPLLTTDFSDTAVLAESLTMAFLVVLEQLKPVERAVFLLREVFEYDYEQIAGMLGITGANARQILHRAKTAVEQKKRARREAPREEARAVLAAFGAAVQGGDLSALMRTLDPEVTFYSDGGGKAKAALNPIHTADRVGRFLIGATRKWGGDAVYRNAEVNRAPAVLRYQAGRLDGVLVFEISDGRIQNLYSVTNPEKLQRLEKGGVSQ